METPDITCKQVSQATQKKLYIYINFSGEQSIDQPVLIMPWHDPGTLVVKTENVYRSFRRVG